MKLLSKQQGLTLVELMITAALSIVVVYFVTNIMLSSSRNSQQSEGLAQAQENSRFILTWLQSGIRRAGFPNPEGMATSGIQPFANLCPAGSPVPPADNADCSFEADDQSDRIAVQRTFYTNGTDAEKSDCSGAAITGRTTGDIITDVYWLETETTVDIAAGYNRVLKCVSYYNHTKVNPSQSIASGIESLHILYGLAQDLGNDASGNPINPENKTSVYRYASLTELGSNLNWSMIQAVRIGILTRSFSEATLEKKSRTYSVLDATAIVENDRVARQLLATTILLPN
ncbi:MAG: PilW family protein [Venatoribacter sp.]